MASTDRILGVLSGLAIKAPVRIESIAPLTLSGEQTVNSVAVVAGDRVLVKDQADAKENGIYDVAVGAWTRALDWDGSRDVVTGTAVVVAESGDIYYVTTAGDIVVGTTEVNFAQVTVPVETADTGVQRKFKGTNESVTSSDVLQDDDELVGMTVAANQAYKLRGYLLYSTNSSATPDIRFNFNFSQTPQFCFYRAWECSGAGAGVIDGESISSTEMHVPSLSSGVRAVIIEGLIKGHATLPSTMKLQWAQRVSNANATTVRQGSHLELIPVSDF